MSDVDRPDGAAMAEGVGSNAPKRGTVDRAEWLADKLHNTNDYGKEAAALLVEQARQIERLRYELRIYAAEQVAAEREWWMRSLAAARRVMQPIWRERMGAESVLVHVQRGLRCIDSAMAERKLVLPSADELRGE